MTETAEAFPELQSKKDRIILRRFHGWVKNDDGTISIEIYGVHKFVFNKEAAKVWELINEDNTLEDIVAEMVKLGGDGASEDEVRKDVYTLVDSLLKQDLVVFEHSIWSEDE